MITLSRPKPLVLVVLDGFGESSSAEANAVRMACTPNLDALSARAPRTLISASGPEVGLPVGQMGNSEVGHMNLGAGRIAQMDLSRIDVAVSEGALGSNRVISEIISKARLRRGAVHLMGLVSDGGVHSTLEHLLALIAEVSAQGVKSLVHAFLDGRDTPPRSAGDYLEKLSKALDGRGQIATVSGRYYAMDRDTRWGRVARAYNSIVHAQGPRYDGWRTALRASYDASVTDEFVEPRVIGDYSGLQHDTDSGLFFNFRPDRARELSLALTAESFSFFDRGVPKTYCGFACMTQYDPTLGLPVAFPKVNYTELFPEIVSQAGLGQFRCAETEKYAHVTYFFNGGREAPFEGEERKLIPSPRDVATYDLKPPMSAQEVTLSVSEAIRSGRYDFVLVNYANPDMVGHTGVLKAAIEAVESVDLALGVLLGAVEATQGAMIITADHGNCEQMIDPITGQPHTAHTLNPVPLWLVSEGIEKQRSSLRPGGRLCDVAPTMLALMGLPQPLAMTGRSLL